VRSAEAQNIGNGMKLLWGFLEYDFYVINWTRVEYEPQKQTNK